MRIKPIRNDKDYAEALSQIERLWGADDGTPESDRLEILVTLVEAYERTNFPIDMPNPLEAIRFRLEQQGEDVKALVGVIGSRTRVYEVLRGDRSLTLPMIRRLHKHLRIPAEVLIRTGNEKRGRAA